VELFDIYAQPVLDVVTDANGEIHWSTGISSEDDSVLVERVGSGVNPTPAYQGPFTLKVNHKAPKDSLLPAYELKFDWPGTVFANGTQYRPCSIPVTLAVPTGTPAPDFTWSPGGGAPPTSVVFTNESRFAPVWSVWQWDFGDGSCSLRGFETIFLTLGSADITGGGWFGSSMVGCNVVGNFIPAGTTVVSVLDEFTLTMSAAAEADDWSLVKIYQGGMEQIEASPTHVYATVGTYTVTLYMAEYWGGPSYSKQAVGAVFVADPIAPAFSVSPGGGLVPLTVQFNDRSGGIGINAWTWTFGDGNWSSEQNPTHIYASPGLYSVYLEVISPYGTDNISVNGAVFVADPSQGQFVHNPAPVTYFNPENVSVTPFIPRDESVTLFVPVDPPGTIYKHRPRKP